MHIAAFIISLLFGISVFGLGAETLSATMPAGAGIGAVPLPMIVAFAGGAAFIAGGYMAMKRKQYARTVLWAGCIILIAAYALDPNGLVFTGNEKDGLASTDLLGVAFFAAVAAGLSHFDAYRQRINQRIKDLEDSKAKGVMQ